MVGQRPLKPLIVVRIHVSQQKINIFIMLILLDGSKGAGKTSTSNILLENLKNAIYLGLDAERRKLPVENKTRKELNREAFVIILNKVEENLINGKNVIVDCGLTTERVSNFEIITQNTKAKLYKFFLKADKDTLLTRVQNRDLASNRATNIERFNEVYNIIHSKEFDGFEIIETDKLSIEEVASAILALLNNEVLASHQTPNQLYLFTKP